MHARGAITLLRPREGGEIHIIIFAEDRWGGDAPHSGEEEAQESQRTRSIIKRNTGYGIPCLSGAPTSQLSEAISSLSLGLRVRRPCGHARRQQFAGAIDPCSVVAPEYSWVAISGVRDREKEMSRRAATKVRRHMDAPEYKAPVYFRCNAASVSQGEVAERSAGRWTSIILASKRRHVPWKRMETHGGESGLRGFDSQRRRPFTMRVDSRFADRSGRGSGFRYYRRRKLVNGRADFIDRRRDRQCGADWKSALRHALSLFVETLFLARGLMSLRAAGDKMIGRSRGVSPQLFARLLINRVTTRPARCFICPRGLGFS